MNKPTAIKLLAVASPIILALATYFFGDVIPMAYDVCQAVLPNGSVTRMGYTVPIKLPPTGDAGAAQ